MEMGGAACALCNLFPLKIAVILIQICVQLVLKMSPTSTVLQKTQTNIQLCGPID